MSYQGLKDAISRTLVVEKLEQWEWFNRFIEMNPDLQERWEQHKIYEKLKDEQL